MKTLKRFLFLYLFCLLPYFYANAVENKGANKSIADLFQKGNELNDKGDFGNATVLYIQSLKIAENEKDYSKCVEICSKISHNYCRLFKMNKALYFAEISVEYALKSNQKNDLSIAYSSLAGAYFDLQEYEKSIKNYKISNSYIADKKSEKYSYNIINLLSCYIELSKYDVAYSYLEDLKNTFINNKDTLGLGSVYRRSAYIEELKGNNQKALSYYHEAYSLLKNSIYLTQISEIISGLLTNHAMLCNGDSVYYYHDQFRFNEDKQLELRHNTDLNAVEAEYKIKRKDQQLKLQKETNKRLNLENERSNLLVWILLLTSSLILILICFLIFFMRQQKKLNTLELNQKNHKIAQLISNQEKISVEAQIKGESETRKKIASDLHDNVGGLLATLGMFIQNIKLYSEEDENKRSQIEKLIRKTVEDVRGLSHSLYYSTVNEGLKENLQQLQLGINNSKIIHFDLHFEIDHLFISDELSDDLFKIIQELTSNTLKHAKASKIEVQISYIESDSEIQLIFEDNGIGFNPSEVSQKNGIGFSTIESRVEKHKGTFTIDSNSDVGTTIIITFPIELNSK